MSVTVKDGVRFDVIAPAGFVILQALKDASKSLGVDIVITSGTDGDHSGMLDPHKSGEAFDVRSHDYDPKTKQDVIGAVMALLGRNHFFGFIESPGGPSEHYHFQRRIGTRYTVEEFLNG